MKPHFLIPVVTMLMLSGCVGAPDDPYPNIKIVDQIAVMGCKHIGNLSSSSKNYGFFTETATESRLQMAKKEAYKLGATHIVLDAPVEDGNATVSNGAAYICP